MYGGFTTWGQLAKNYGVRKGFKLIENFKLFLSPDEGSYQDEYYNLPDRSREDIVEVIAMYFTYLKRHLVQYIIDKELGERQIFFTEKEPHIRYVLTIPGMLNSSAKQVIVEAAVLAGLVSEERIKDLVVITEPQAAALYCKKHYGNFEKKNRTTFIICDAGGGFVDSATFSLSVDKGSGEESITEVSEGEGDTCGSAYLDANFRKYLLDFYADVGSPHDETTSKLDIAMNYFIDTIKVYLLSFNFHIYVCNYLN